MGVLIKDMEMPKSCYECKLDLRSDVCKAFCEWNAEHPYSIRTKDRLPDCPLSEVPELCEDTVLRASVEYICRKNTVSTNPYEHKYHDKFIQFMDDPEISDFGRWQHSNGFNTALVAVQCDLDKVPSAQPEPLSDAYMKAVWTWLLEYQIKAAELKGRYTPYEVLSWVANDWRKEHE